MFAQFEGSALHIVNSVFYDNRVDSNSDGIGNGAEVYNDRGDVLMVNVIAWGNTGSVIFNENAVITVAIQYSDVEGGYGEAADMNIEVSKSSLMFDDTAVGATASLDLVIANAGDQALSITAITLSDDTHFAVTVPVLPATFPSGSHLTLTVIFTPAGAGLQEADLTISTNDPDEALTVVGLSGTGLAVNHTITASAGAEGQISPSGAVTVSQGSDQAFTITAGSGYNLANVLVDGASVGTVGSYTFTSVSADHTIEALFEPQTGFAVGAVSGATSEDGTSATFTVVLTQEPSADVVIPVASNDTLEVSVSTDNLVFTPANWDTPQTVTISGLDDDDQTDPPKDDGGGGGGGGGGCFIRSMAK